MGPLAFLAVAVHKVSNLVARNRVLKSDGLVFKASPKRSVKEMWAEVRTVPGAFARGMQVFIYFMDLRFRGAWVKHNPEAKFWGFLMGGFTDNFWLIILWVHAKKVAVALNKRLLGGSSNALLNVVLYVLDFLLFAWQVPFRDNLVNFSQSLAAAANLAAIIVAALPLLLPEHLIPGWLYGPVVMWITVAGTSILTVAAALDPVLSFFGLAIAFGRRLSVSCLATGELGKACGLLQTILWVRFQTICLNRSKKAALAKVERAKDEESAYAASVQQHPRTGIQCHGVVYKRGHLHTKYRKRLFVLREGVVKYFRLDDMTVVDGDYCDQSSQARGTISCADLTVSTAEDKHDKRFFHFVVTESSGRKTYCKTETDAARTKWICALTRVTHELL